MVTVTITQVLLLILPFVSWIVGVKARIPFLVLLSGVIFLAVGVFFLSVIPVWLSLMYGLLGLMLIVGTVLVTWK